MEFIFATRVMVLFLLFNLVSRIVISKNIFEFFAQAKYFYTEGRFENNFSDLPQWMGIYMLYV